MTQYVPPTSQGLPPPPPGASRPRASSHTDRYVPDEYKARPPLQQQPSAPGEIPTQPRARGPSIAGQTISATPPVANAGYFPNSLGQAMVSTTPMGMTPPIANAPYPGTSPGYFRTPPGNQGGYFGGTPQPGAPYPYDPQHPGYPAISQSQQLAPPPTNAAGHIMFEPQGRRASASSHHSHRSGRSRHSGRSSGQHSRRDSPHHHSHHRRHSEEIRRRDYDDDEEDSDSEYDGRSRRRERHFDRDRRYSEGATLKPSKSTRDHRPSWGDTIYSMFGVIKDALGPRDKYP